MTLNTNAAPPTSRRRPHGHMWLVGLLGVAAGLVLLVYVPTLSLVGRSILLFAGFHVVGAIVLASSLWASALRPLARRWMGAEGRAARADRFDFGWGPGWMNGLAIAGLVGLAAATTLIVTAPTLWPLSFLLVALSVVFAVGNLIMRGFRRVDQAVLPMTDLLSGDHDLILDAGCGAGRTTVALGRIMKAGRVIGLDRFDADYIDDGGRALFDHNLKIAGLTGRAEAVAGDLTAMPFPDGHFDASASTHVYDHLGSGKAAALAETLRVLKPGGRFLMGVWVPGWSMFAVGSVFSLFLTSKAAWRGMAKSAGFAIVEEDTMNGAWFLLIEKPASSASAGAGDEVDRRLQTR